MILGCLRSNHLPRVRMIAYYARNLSTQVGQLVSDTTQPQNYAAVIAEGAFEDDASPKQL